MNNPTKLGIDEEQRGRQLHEAKVKRSYRGDTGIGVGNGGGPGREGTCPPKFRKKLEVHGRARREAAIPSGLSI